MSVLPYVAIGAVVSLPIALALGPRWRRQLGLALAGVVLLGVLVGYAYGAGCPESAHECSPLLGLILGGFILTGWLLGIAAAALRRVWLRWRRP